MNFSYESKVAYPYRLYSIKVTRIQETENLTIGHLSLANSVVDLSVVDPDPNPELLAGSGLGSGINHFGSGSGLAGSGMNLIPNFSV